MSKVKLKNLKNNLVLHYTLVAEEEANLAAGKISVKSPIGKGLLGKVGRRHGRNHRARRQAAV